MQFGRSKERRREAAFSSTKRRLQARFPGTKRHRKVAFLLCAAASTAACAFFNAVQAQPLPPLIALDTGHYLAAAGATSARGVTEFTFNSALVRAVDVRLREAGLRTELIGIDGMASDLAARPRRAKEAGALLFISFHHDSARSSYLRDWEYDGAPRKYLDDRFQGYSLFVSRQNPQWRQALDCASALGSQLRAAGFKPSRYHADPVIGEAREFADEANGVHFFDNLAVLRHATVPALLFEAGVIVNRDEEARLGLESTRKQIADAVEAAMPVCVAQAIKALGVPVPVAAATPATPQRNTTKPRRNPQQPGRALAAPPPVK